MAATPIPLSAPSVVPLPNRHQQTYQFPFIKIEIGIQIFLMHHIQMTFVKLLFLFRWAEMAFKSAK